MSRRAVNIATISEEDITGEEIGEDGMVEVVSKDRLSVESFGEESSYTDGIDIRRHSRKKSSDSADDDDKTRRSSVVENDDDTLSMVPSSILKAISSLDGPSSKSSKYLSMSRSTESLPSLSSSNRHLSKGGVSRSSSWRGNRSPGSTMNLTGKFLTELTMYDPLSGPVKNCCINLGLFIATDQTMGDHFVYKISPVSPFTALKIQQQDRLLKINDISVSGWSHSCLVEFIRNLPLSFVNNEESYTDKVFEMPFSMELRKSGRYIRSSDESPSSKRVSTIIKIRKQRASVQSVHESVVRVKHSKTSIVRIKLKTKCKDENDLYLKTSRNHRNIISCHIGHHHSQDDAVFFRLHHFDVSPPKKEPGDVVVIEIPGGDGYLHPVSLDSVAVMHVMACPPSTLFQIDLRFFNLNPVSGTSTFRIRNYHTGQYLSATKHELSLIRVEDDVMFPASTEFEIIVV